MATVEEIKNLAYAIWEQEGRPEGKDQEHYYRAKKILEDQETAGVKQQSASPAPAQFKAVTDKNSAFPRRKR